MIIIWDNHVKSVDKHSMIHIILGTKAQLIKMAPVMKEFMDQGLEYRFISTGQHRDTMDDILRNFGLKSPDYVLYEGPDITSIPKMILWATRILWLTLHNRSSIFSSEKNSIVLVHGDTFSTLLGALMGRFAGLKIGHVESGLRSFNLFHPFPEEITRLITFRLSHYLFCPGPWAMENVRSYPGVKVDTGENTLADALRLAVKNIEGSEVDIPHRPFAVVTLHRYENIYSRSALERIVDIVEGIAQQKSLLFILHNPTKKKLKEYSFYNRLASSKNIEFRKRYDYFRFIKLISAADFVISDGGSNQEECYYLGKPVLLLRKSTERQEGLDENCILSKYEPNTITSFLDNWKSHRRNPQQLENSASEIIVNYCQKHFEV